MKVKGFTTYSSGVRVDVACSQCGTDIAHTFSYCPKCGRKLYTIAPSIDYARVCELITNDLRDATAKEEMKHIIIGGADVTDEVGKAIESSEHEKKKSESKLEPICPRCKNSPKGCEFLSTDGTCRGIVYPTYPPQYDRCTLLKPGETPSIPIMELNKK